MDGLIKKPFVLYTLDEDKADPEKAGKVFSIRLTGKQYQELRQDMKMLNINREGTAYKFMHDTGRNVLLNTFGGEVSNIFRRKKKNEELDYYHKGI